MKFISKFLILFVLLCLIKKFNWNWNYKIIYDIPEPIKESKVDFDIVISPGGRYGMYNLGICHYIKNHFDIKNKKIVGFSAGSWNALFMCMKKEYMSDAIKKSFSLNKETVPNMLKKTINILEKYNIADFDINHLYIATSSFNKTIIYNKFMLLEELTRCCTSSSFIPILTYKDIFYFYKNRLTYDGGLHYKKFKKTLSSKTLIISFKMFGRYKNANIFKERLKKCKTSAYQLYIKGYHDAIKNHSYFEQYLN